MPEAEEDRQQEGQRQRVEGIEEGRAAHDDARPHVPARERHALEPRDQRRACAPLPTLPLEGGGNYLAGSDQMKSPRFFTVVPAQATRLYLHCRPPAAQPPLSG